MICMKEMIVDQQNLMDLLLDLHRKFKEDPATGNRLDLSGCIIERIVIQDFDFAGVHCNGTHFQEVDFRNITNPPWERPSGCIYGGCSGLPSKPCCGSCPAVCPIGARP